MSASTVTPKNRETIYKRLIEAFLKGGNDQLLEKFFALGKGWDKDIKHFQYLYLNLLCNFTCDVEYYFNQKLKEWATLDIETKINLQEVISENDNYSIVVQKTDNVTLVEALLKDVNCTINDQISTTL
jgi:hypothetical protein